jgi:hypothetical protein
MFVVYDVGWIQGHENVEVDEGTDDRATLVASLQKAVAERLGRRR